MFCNNASPFYFRGGCESEHPRRDHSCNDAREHHAAGDHDPGAQAEHAAQHRKRRQADRRQRHHQRPGRAGAQINFTVGQLSE